MVQKSTDSKYDYILEWIRDAAESRREQTRLTERAINAYQGIPEKNNYKKAMKSLASKIAVNDGARGKSMEDSANDVPDKPSWVIQEGVEASVSMTQGGVGRYEFGPYDPEMQKSDRVIDRLSSAAIHFYNTERVDSIMPQFIRNAALAGASYLHVKQKNGKKLLTLLTADQMLIDSKRNKTNYERFIGYEQRESLTEYKSKIRKNRRGAFIKTLNEAEVYLDQIIQEVNDVRQGNPIDEFRQAVISHDVDMFYTGVVSACREARKSDPDHLYSGDEIVVSYVYDHMNDMYFEIINRRYVVVGKANPLKRKIKVSVPNMDETKPDKEITKEIRLDSPIVELPYMKVSWASYPITPVFYILDDFDDLCAQESVLFHNLSVQAPITFVGQAGDVENVARIASISGELVDALPQTFGVLDKTHDNSPIIAAIQRSEDKIKRVMHATDQFALQAMIGDRASAKEVTALSSQVSQGLNPFITNIEAAMAKLGDVFIKMELILNDKVYSFTHEGRYGELEAEDMAGDYTISAKLTSSIKLEQEAASRKALELTQYLGGTDKIDPKEFFGTMIPIVLAGLVNREQAKRMIAEQYRPLPEEEIARIKRNAEIDAKKDPIDKLDLDRFSTDELDQMIAQVSGVSADPQAQFLPDDMAQAQAQAQSQYPNAQGAPMDMGQMPQGGDPLAGTVLPGGPVPSAALPAESEAAGIVANDPAGQGYTL